MLDLIKQLNVDYRLTIFLIEHRIDRVLPFLSQMIIMNDGKILMQGPPQTVLRIPLERYGLVTPAIVQFWNALAEYHSQKKKFPLSFEQHEDTLTGQFLSLNASLVLNSLSQIKSPSEKSHQYYENLNQQDPFLEISACFLSI